MIDEDIIFHLLIVMIDTGNYLPFMISEVDTTDYSVDKIFTLEVLANLSIVFISTNLIIIDWRVEWGSFFLSFPHLFECFKCFLVALFEVFRIYIHESCFESDFSDNRMTRC